MRTLLSQLWDDDRGAVISVELILVVGILVFGIIPGLVAMRNSVTAALASLANLISMLTPTFTFSQVSLGGGQTGYVLIGQFNTNAPTVSSVPVAPVNVDANVVSPAP